MLHPSNGPHQTVEIGGRVGNLSFSCGWPVGPGGAPEERSILGIDVATQKIVAEFPLGMEPEHLCFNSDQGQLFVTGQGMDAVAIVFPFQTMEVEQTILAARNPGVMAASDTPALLFIASETAPT